MIVDINLPNENGLKFIEKIREADHSTKVIVLTAYSSIEYLIKATKLRLTDYLIKPLNGKTLDNTLQKAMDEIKRFKTISTEIVHLKDNFKWYAKEQKLYNDTQSIELTLLEKKLLTLFIKNQNIMLSSESIIMGIYDTYEDNKLNSLKIVIKKLRKKLPIDTILNIYKEGYILKN
jgi:two-component system, OmpR family, response regulator VanR